MPNMRRSRAGFTPDPQEYVATASVLHQSMSVWEATSMADLPVVPLEQDTKKPVAATCWIQSSTPSASDPLATGTRWVETVSSHLDNRSQRFCASQLSG